MCFSLLANTQTAGPERPPQPGGVRSLPQPLERPSGAGLQGKRFFFCDEESKFSASLACQELLAKVA